MRLSATTVACCRCPRGRRLIRLDEDDGLSTSKCEPINECLELRDPCHGGRCLDADDGYVCECVAGRGGPTCAERRESRLSSVDISFGAVAIIIACVVLLLGEFATTHIVSVKLQRINGQETEGTGWLPSFSGCGAYYTKTWSTLEQQHNTV